jgi:tetratricopeptide (TPR) repeat protein
MMPNTRSGPASIAAQYSVLLQTVCDISETYYYLGRLDDALHLLDAGMRLLDQQEVEPSDRVKLLLQLGKIQVTTIFLANGDFDAAMVTLSRAKVIAESIADRQQLGVALNFIGQAHYFKALNSGDGDFETPRVFFQQALDLSQAAGDLRNVSDSLFQVGITYERQEQYDTASAYYRQAIELADQHGYKREKSYAARHLAIIYQARGELDQALRYFQESLALREEIGLKIYLPFAHIAVGDVLYDTNDSVAALAHYQAAHDLSAEMGLKSGLIASLLSMGYAHQDHRELPKARECFEQAHTLAQSIGFQRGMAMAAAELEAINKPGSDEWADQNNSR